MKRVFDWIVTGTVLLTLGGCEKSDPSVLQGYVEGEFVYIAAPLAAQLEKLDVDRGQTVEKGQALFSLDATTEKAKRDQAASLLAQARATLEDVRQGQRPSELASLEAQIKNAEAALDHSNHELERQKGLAKTGASPTRDLDDARTQAERDEQTVAQLTADLATARLGSRDAQISAAEQAMHAQEAALAAAEWQLSQQAQVSPVAGAVNDVLFRPGDWVEAGKPVVVLLPPAHIKVRTFVPEGMLGQVHAMDEVRVTVDGGAGSFTGHVSFISPKAEYTPPVIYSTEMRQKFVYLVEIQFPAEAATQLHPGQPVTVRFPGIAHEHK
jgi:HlyD family secretion protein